MQDTLQMAVEVVDKYAKECALRCSPQKSVLVVVRKRAPKILEDIRVVLDGEYTVPSPSVKILGLVIESNTKADACVRKLKHTTEQIVHMLNRVASKRRGMKENDTLRLIQAYLVPRITYVAPHLLFNAAQKKQIDVIIRKVIKQAIGVPISASTDRLMSWVSTKR
ncbi:hypothetical protein MTO96_017965 [Rhipicephalus appendiculatus]